MEEELIEQPESINDDFEDGFDEVSNEIIAESKGAKGDDEFTETEETSNTEETETESDTNTEEEVEGEQEKIDFKPFLEYLSKHTKYNKENVNVENIEDVISNFQKGLNYEKLQNKIDSLESGKALTYINTKARELGMSVDEYMDQVEAYEKEQERQRKEEEFEKMVNSGIPEEYARELLASSEVRKQLQEELNQLKEQKKEQEEKANKDKEYDDFINEFPNVKAEDIPKEVFENANVKGETLTQAYKDYLFEEMKKEISQIKQNEENSKRSVGSTQSYGAKDSQGPVDLFLEGFDS